ncbi:response regulator transcription factor [Occallatibacter savannae]|uniref:response regulator transcription factor n=1 Tax=Occallatibacter savannae TaxID=1002691 RepID=UPI000D6860CA|nr:response regulator transcription factor [Occallatibacter savannae]
MTNASVSEQVAPLVKKSVLVIDDHPLLRQGLAMLINQQGDLRVCGEAEDLRVAMQAIVQLNPDIVVLDISLKGPDGLEVLKTIRAANPTLPVLVLSMHDEAIYAERALRARANGYIMKQEATEKVLVAIRSILNGEVYLSDAMSRKLLQQFIDGTPSFLDSREGVLSDRELEVFRLIGEGRSTREIAEELRLSVKTVETYQAHIKEKLGLKSGRELIQHAIQSKLNGKPRI